MKQKVTLDLTKKKTGEKFSIDFYSVEKIDRYINTLQAMRCELVRKIEMEKQRKAQKSHDKPRTLIFESIGGALNGGFIELLCMLESLNKTGIVWNGDLDKSSVEEEAEMYKQICDSYNNFSSEMKAALSPLMQEMKKIHKEFVKSHNK